MSGLLQSSDTDATSPVQCSTAFTWPCSSLGFHQDISRRQPATQEMSISHSVINGTLPKQTITIRWQGPGLFYSTPCAPNA